MPDMLETIVEARKKTVRDAKERISRTELEKVAANTAGRSFAAALIDSGRISVIAEMKTKSPSAGPIRSPYDPAAIARAYEKGGAAALSVLTEPEYFGGSVSDLKKAREASGLPILRKDFIFDAFQIAEAKALGADAVLLIADMLDPTQLKELVDYSHSLGLDPLVEIFTSDAAPAAINSEAKLIGINTRNLRTLEMKPDNVFALSRMIPWDRVIVAESGLKTPDDIEKLKAFHIQAVLVGESLLKEPDLETAVRRLVEAGQRSDV